jgi:hypothetical protein
MCKRGFGPDIFAKTAVCLNNLRVNRVMARKKSPKTNLCRRKIFINVKSATGKEKEGAGMFREGQAKGAGPSLAQRAMLIKTGPVRGMIAHRPRTACL